MSQLSGYFTYALLFQVAVKILRSRGTNYKKKLDQVGIVRDHLPPTVS